MKLYKNTYNLNGGSYQPKAIVVPTDSAYAIGVQFVKDGQPIEINEEDVTLIDGDTTLSASDVYHNYAVFEMEASSDERDDKKYKVEYTVESDIVTGSYSYDQAGYPLVTLSDFLPDDTAELDWSKFWCAYKVNGTPQFEDLEQPKLHTGDKTPNSILTTPAIGWSVSRSKYYILPVQHPEKGLIWIKLSSSASGLKPITDDMIIDTPNWQTMKDDGYTYNFYVGAFVGVSWSALCGYGTSKDSAHVSFDNLIVNQKENSVVDYYPVETEEE